MRVSIVILTHNSQRTLDRCIASAKLCSDDIVLIDDLSIDGTLSYKDDASVKFFTRRLSNFAEQRNFGISKASYNWILHLDSDEVLTNELIHMIRQTEVSDDVDAFRFKFRHVIFGRELVHGGMYPDWHIRIHRREVRFVGAVHEYLDVAGSRVKDLDGAVEHFSTITVDEWFRKLLVYGPKERKISLFKAVARAIGILGKKYVFQMGFLDGVEGAKWYLLSSLYPLLTWTMIDHANCGEDNYSSQ